MTKRSHMNYTADEVIAMIDKFAERRFRSVELRNMIKSCINEDMGIDEKALQKVAERWHVEIVKQNALISQILEEFSPHPATRFSLLRSTIRPRVVLMQHNIKVARGGNTSMYTGLAMAGV